MRFSKRTEYGLRAMVQLARLGPGQFVQSRDLAEQEGLPTKFLESILLSLRRAGFLESKVGSGGGYKLAVAPRQVQVGDVVRRLERGDDDAPPAGTAAPKSPPKPGALACDLLSRRLDAAADAVLDDQTLEGLVEEVNRALGTQEAMYYI